MIWRWLKSIWAWYWPTPPKLEAEQIRQAKGGCGVHGCANKRPHSHVDALVKRLREKP